MHNAANVNRSPARLPAAATIDGMENRTDSIHIIGRITSAFGGTDAIHDRNVSTGCPFCWQGFRGAVRQWGGLPRRQFVRLAIGV